MVVATRVMYLMSGVFVVMSCVCVELRFGSELTEFQRIIAGSLSLLYFALQFVQFVRKECTTGGSRSSCGQCRKLGLDIEKQ